MARCDGCDRPLCLTCAIPVRGQVFGPECMAEILGDDPAVHEEGPVVSRLRPATVAFVLAVGSTLLPWTTVGAGSGPLGAWGTRPHWSLLAATSALAGLLVAARGRRVPGTARRWEAGGAGLGLLLTLASVLAWFRPPFPADATLTPWVAALAGAVATADMLMGAARRARA